MEELCTGNLVELKDCAATVKPENLQSLDCPEQEMQKELSSLSLEEISNLERVFDTSRYIRYPYEIREKVTANDLAGMAIEIREGPLEERINPWTVVLTGEGKVLDLTNREPVEKNFGEKTELARKERKAALSFYYEHFKNAKPGEIIFWVSPQKEGVYGETRINVGRVRLAFGGVKFLECFGIASQMSPQECVYLAKKESGREDSESLRETSFKVQVPKGESPWLYLKKEKPIDSNAWESIYQKNPQLLKNHALEVAKSIARVMNENLRQVEGLKISDRDHFFVEVGAYGESAMRQMGWTMRRPECEGETNLTILGLISNLSAKFNIDGFGSLRKKESGGKYVEECPYCHETIKKKIKAGYVCKCGQVYQGVC